jgi:hypothetical protein
VSHSRPGLCALAGLAALLLVPPDAAAEGATVVITKADCSQLVKHVPSADVPYQPGVDVNGNPVVPADLNGARQVEPPDDFTIDIEVELFERFGIPVDPDQFEATALIGKVEYRHGRLYFNGQPLQDEAAAALAERCQKIDRGTP